MKKQFRIIAALLAALELFSLVSCGKTGEPALTEATSAEQTTEAEPLRIDFFANDTKYVMVRGDEASTSQIESFMRLKRSVKEKTGTDMELKTDWVKDESQIKEFEILFGSTNRPETAEALAKIEGTGYAVCVINKKLVIAATSDKALGSAVTWFEEVWLAGEDRSFEENFIQLGVETAIIQNVTINGTALRDFTLVVKNKKVWELPAYTLTDFAEKYCGINLTVASESSNVSGSKIVLGGKKADGSDYGQFETELYFKDGDLHIGCANTTMAQKAVYTFIAQYLGKAGTAAAELPADGSPVFNSTQPDDWSMADPGDFITIQDRICRSAYMAQAILEYDTSLGKPFSYRGSDYKSTLAAARSSDVRLTNCVILSNWVMKQAGFYDSGIYNIKYDGTTGYTFGGNTASFFKANFDIIDVRDKNANVPELTSSGDIKAGDIIIYQNHTMIVLPLGYSLDGGRGHTKEKKADSEFVTWVGTTLYPTMIAGYIFRPKDSE